MPALLAVIAAYMGGIAAGAWAISRVHIHNAGRCYAALELGIGAWAACTAFLLPHVNQFAIAWIGIDPSPLKHWAVAFVIPFVVLLPATAAMGATLPVIEWFITPLTWRRRSVAALYASNTLGAVAGVLISTFIILPRFGLTAALLGFAGINIACGLIALAVSRNPEEMREIAAPESVETPRRLGTLLFLTGMLGIGYEVIGVRLLAQVLENTVYTYAAVLAIFLLGTSLGAAIYHCIGSRWTLADLLGATAVTCVAGVFAATQADDLYPILRKHFGDRPAGVLLAEMSLSASVFLFPAMAMGATFSHLAQSTRHLPGGLGRTLAINTMGAAAAPTVFSVLLVPWLGSKWSLVIIVGSYLIASGKLIGWRWFVAASVAFLALLPSEQLRFIHVPAGGRVLEFREGVMASVAVVEDATAHRSLRVDNRFQMGGTGVADAEYRHAHIPLLLHPNPRRALFLGLGTGITFDAAALHTNVTADGVELLPEVVHVMPQFSPYNNSVRTNERLRTFVADARRFVQSTTNIYDVIVGDLFHPARDGAGSLYSVEHFRSIRERLTDKGLFCQWLPLHQLDEQTLRVIIRTFLEVFPNAQAWLLRFNVETPVIGLVGSIAPVQYVPDWMETRSESPLLAERLQKLVLADSIRIFGNFLAGPVELRAICDNAGLNTDDNSAVLFGAPRFTYRDNSEPWDRLTPFLQPTGMNAAGVLGFSSPALDGFWRARDAFLAGLIAESLARDDEAQRCFIESARLSDEFTAGYARVLTMAMAKSKAQPAESRLLLEQLIAAQPSRPVAGQLLKRLFPAETP